MGCVELDDIDGRRCEQTRGKLASEEYSEGCRLEWHWLEYDEEVEERLTIMPRMSSLRDAIDVSKKSCVCY